MCNEQFAIYFCLWQRRNQVSQILAIAHLMCPELQDVSLPFLHVGRLEVLQLALHPRPHVLYGVQTCS